MTPKVIARVMPPHGHMTPNGRSEWQRAWFRRTVKRLGLALNRLVKKEDRATY